MVEYFNEIVRVFSSLPELNAIKRRTSVQSILRIEQWQTSEK